MSRLLAAAALALLLAGCQTLDPDARLSLEADVACRSAAGSLDVLSTLRARGGLSAETIATVNRVKPRIDAVCLSPVPPTSREIVASVTDAAFDLLAAERAATAPQPSQTGGAP